jgi:hypothetical protein
MIDQFEESLNEFTLDIEITEIAGVEGDWKYSIKLNKSDIKENKTYSFYDYEEFMTSERIAVKTNYTPIALDVKNVSISDFSSVMEITWYSVQNGVPEEKRIEPKKIISAMSPEYNTNEWNEVESFVLEVKDSDDNILLLEDYDYTRAEWVLEEKLLFPNLEKDTNKLTLNIYLKGAENEKELAGTISVNIENETNTSKDKYKLDTEKTILNGRLSVKTSSKWTFDSDIENGFNIQTLDNFGKGVSINFSELNEESYKMYTESFGVKDIKDKKELAEKSANYDMSTASESKILSQGEEKIGIFDTYQITYYVKYSNNNDKMKNKIMFAEIEDKMYVIEITADSEISYENNIEFCEDVVKSIKINN